MCIRDRYYENRADKIAQLDKPEITGRILDAIEAADLDPSQEEKLEREFALSLIHIFAAAAVCLCKPATL